MNKLFHSLQVWEKMQPIDFKVIDNLEKDFLILMKGLRVLELSEALNVDSSDLLAVCAILKIKATSRLSMLSFEECKKITDYYENKN